MTHVPTLFVRKIEDLRQCSNNIITVFDYLHTFESTALPMVLIHLYNIDLNKMSFRMESPEF